MHMEPRGSRRLPHSQQWDAQLQKDFAIGPVRADVIASVFNILNTEIATARDGSVGDGTLDAPNRSALQPRQAVAEAAQLRGRVPAGVLSPSRLYPPPFAARGAEVIEGGVSPRPSWSARDENSQVGLTQWTGPPPAGACSLFELSTSSLAFLNLLL